MCIQVHAPLSSFPSNDELPEVHLNEDDVILRAQWSLDGSKTLDEVIQKLQTFISYIRELQDEGYELRDTIYNDWGFLERQQA